MPRKQQKRSNNCPVCGTEVEKPYKTWQLIAPFPDKKMRITVTIFGMFQCPKCNKRFRGIAGKAKLGTEGIEIG